jgi:hypothetical protein
MPVGGGGGRCVGWLRHFLQLLVTETGDNSYCLAKQGLTKLSKTAGSDLLPLLRLSP